MTPPTLLLGRLRCKFCGHAWKALWMLQGQSPGRQCPMCGETQSGIPEGQQLDAATHPTYAGFAAMRAMDVKRMRRYQA